MILNQRTLVLNRNWVPINVTSVLQALCKLYDGAARVVDPDDFAIYDFDGWVDSQKYVNGSFVRTATRKIPVPQVILLVRYGEIPARKPAFSRRNIYKRDKYTCQYCGAQPGMNALTIDHVMPKSRSGPTNWTNCVASCVPCNKEKADRTPDEAGYRLKTKPVKPDWSPDVVFSVIQGKDVWRRFVSKGNGVNARSQ